MFVISTLCLLWASLWLVLVFVFVYFSALQAFIFWFSFSFVHTRPNNFLFTLLFVSFHCVFVYLPGMCHFLLLPSLFPCATLHTPLPACPFICCCLGPDWLTSFLKLFWTAAKLCSRLECQYMHRLEIASNGQSETRELPRNSNQLEPIVFDNKLCQ